MQSDLVTPDFFKVIYNANCCTFCDIMHLFPVLHSVSSRDRGWVVVVDARVCHYRLVKPTVSTVRATLGHIRHLFVVRPEGFWDKQRVDCRKSEVDSQVRY